MNTTIMWGDGSSDKITVTYTGTAGASLLKVVSDPNETLLNRTKILELKIDGLTAGTVTVTQQNRSRAYSVDYNNSYK